MSGHVFVLGLLILPVPSGQFGGLDACSGVSGHVFVC